MSAGERIEGLGAVADGFGLFLVDQFGVLHDGRTPYPGAVDCLEKLTARGAKVVILSNSGKRAAENARRMAEIGIPPTAYTVLLTSGEAAWTALARRDEPWSAALGRRCLLLSRGGDTTAVAGLDLALTDRAAAADFVLMAGSDAPERPLAWYDAVLEPALARGLPMICSNPDQTMIVPGLTPDGTTFGAGFLARRYEARGGTVHWFGKPHPPIYRTAFRLASAETGAVAIGDSLEHDIAGGRAAGAATILVLGGIHAATVPEGLPALYDDHGVRPDWVMPRFQWGDP
jgi:HAD superfamily hydrolase (TIGR01459 family)